MRLHVVTVLCLFLIILKCSCSSKIKPKIKRSESLDSNRFDTKRFKRFDDDFIEDMRFIISKDHYELFSDYVVEYGALLLNSNETPLLKYIIDNDKIQILECFFQNVKKDTFDVLLEALSLAAPQKQEIIEAIAKPKFIRTELDKNAILDYFLLMKDEKSLLTVLRNGVEFENWKGRNGSNFAHVAVQKNWISLINYVTGFNEKDKSGLTPIFYAKTPEMVKIIRLNCPGARDQVDKRGRSVWQRALNSKNYELLNALISAERRLKKFKLKQMDYYDIPWVTTASLLNVDRRFVLWNSFDAIETVGMKWYRPNHKFFIKFIGENGIDAGGLKNDWMTNLLQSFFVKSPQESETDLLPSLFVQVDEETGLYAPNRKHKPEVFRLTGSILGIALAMRIPVKQKFIPAVYRALMHEEIDLIADLIEQSPSVYRNLQYLNNSTVKLSDLELTLPSNSAVHVTRRLVPKYIREYSKEILIGRYEKEISALVSGFESVLPVKVNDYFTLDEFKRILTGKPADYTEDEFFEALSCSDSVIKEALKRFVSEISSIQRGLLLKFITGLEALPADGFIGLERKITVEIDERLIGRLPTASTCSFTLKLPPFVDYGTLSRSLITANEWTSSMDNEVGLENDDEGIILGFDSESDEGRNSESDNESESVISTSSDEEISDSDND